MNKTLSLSLDFIRFLCAFLVFITHSEYLLDDNRLSLFAGFGHDAVLFFFILSGIVINYVSSGKEKNIIDFVVARLSRIYSVVIPSFLLTMLLYYIGSFYFSSFYDQYPNIGWFRLALSNLFFLSQSDFNYLSFNIPTNGPFWSICYEVWYYIIFSIFFFMKGKWRYILLVFACIAAGSKILILFPIWISGFLFFSNYKRITYRSNFVGAIIIVLFFIIYSLLRYYNIDDYLFLETAKCFGGPSLLAKELTWSKRFFPDYLISIIYLIMLAGIYISRELISRIICIFEKPIKFLAALTFPLYLFHYPILIFFSQLLSNNTLIELLCIFFVIVFAFFTNKFSIFLYHLFSELFNNIRNKSMVKADCSLQNVD